MTVTMGYQALLFCPDEKTARTVTQVLTDLDFAVVPCTEPFAAVKKLMGEHFDAVVVDCDNEQNATLLFKSARNAPNNQTALAVAVVEGQVGVAKAFRIGANLVLTKPINVEQAKGTLRVARGLLRKGEAAKPGVAAPPAAVKPANPSPPAQKPTAAAATSWPSSPAQAVTPSVPVQSPTARPKSAAAMSAAVGSGAELIDTERAEAASLAAAKSTAKASTPNISSATPLVVDAESGTDRIGIDKTTKTDKIAKTESASASQTAVTPPPSVAPPVKSSGGSGFGSASAPAPAREVKPSPVVEGKASAVAEPQTQIEEVAPTESSANAPTLTFGGTVGADAQPVASGDSKKTLLAVVIVLLIVAAAYVAWTQMGGKIPWISGVAPQPAATPAATTRPTPSAALAAKPVSVLPATLAPNSTVQASAATTPPTNSGENSSDSKIAATTPSTEETGIRSGKTTGASSDSSKPASTVTPTKAPTSKAAAPPVIKKTAATAAATSSDAPAPSLAGISADNGGTLPNLMGSGTTPTPVLQTMNISQGLTQGLILKKTQPTYPSIALQMRIEGPVDLLATISKTGSITAVKILHGDPQLARAAIEAVKQWKYKPYLLDGQPVEIQTQITVNFKLPR
jgi:TonB family protein